ncbi:MAG: hypothetical protein HY901_23365 [Deltaproteobacteria bacterium]|nr:hypothetical protein [Deltaproteobacteria bacterium]
MAAGDERPEVKGRRPTWGERHPGPVPKLVAILIPAALVISATGYGWCAHQGFSEHPVAGTAFGLVGMVALALVAFGGLHGVRGWWVSACPLCGHEAARDFRGGQAAECGGCMAYLRSDEGCITENCDDVVEFVTSYVVRAPDAGGKEPGSLRFPEACVLCGAPPVGRKPIHTFRLRPGEAPKTRPSTLPRRRITLDEQQWEPTAPICEAHRESEPVEIFQGELQFRSYGQYKAFCKMNGIERRGRG